MLGRYERLTTRGSKNCENFATSLKNFFKGQDSAKLEYLFGKPQSFYLFYVTLTMNLFILDLAAV